jgi:hypothetical protein
MSRSNRTKGKGCDIGYALATSSCEGANSVETCTVTALDVNTAFAAPNPDFPLAETVGFFGLERPANCFTEPITQSTSDQKRFISTDPFDRRRRNPTLRRCVVNPQELCKRRFFSASHLRCASREKCGPEIHEKIFTHDIHSSFHKNNLVKSA